MRTIQCILQRELVIIWLGIFGVTGLVKAESNPHDFFTLHEAYTCEDMGLPETFCDDMLLVSACPDFRNVFLLSRSSNAIAIVSWSDQEGYRYQDHGSCDASAGEQNETGICQFDNPLWAECLPDSRQAFVASNSETQGAMLTNFKLQENSHWLPDYSNSFLSYLEFGNSLQGRPINLLPPKRIKSDNSRSLLVASAGRLNVLQRHESWQSERYFSSVEWGGMPEEGEKALNDIDKITAAPNRYYISSKNKNRRVLAYSKGSSGAFLEEVTVAINQAILDINGVIKDIDWNAEYSELLILFDTHKMVSLTWNENEDNPPVLTVINLPPETEAVDCELIANGRSFSLSGGTTGLISIWKKRQNDSQWVINSILEPELLSEPGFLEVTKSNEDSQQLLASNPLRGELLLYRKSSEGYDNSGNNYISSGSHNSSDNNEEVSASGTSSTNNNATYVTPPVLLFVVTTLLVVILEY